MSQGFNGMGARYFDGDRPLGEEVSLHIAAGILQVGLENGRILRWPVKEVRSIPDKAGRQGHLLRWTGDPLARLWIEDAEVLAYLPHLKRRAPPKGRGRLLAWALAAVAAVALQIGFLIPLLADNLATFIPARGERALGEATLGHIREVLDETGLAPLTICEAPEGQAALTALSERLTDGVEMRQALSVLVLDDDMINAFALPGGYVILFRGLIEAADDPDEVAAVLAHEIGHVVSRDPTRHALRSAGSIGVLGLLFGDFAGGAAVLFLTERLISAQYAQSAEADADSFAHDLLDRAEVSPAALGRMFETMRRKHGDAEGITAHFLSHPRLSDRIAAAEAAVVSDADYRPSLSEAQWQALQQICDD